VIRTAFVSTYPPRPGGVATFTHHLAAAVGGREIVALHAEDLPAPYPLEVHHRIRRDEPDDYPRTAEALRGCADVVSLQHEFGLWGGRDGEWVLDFVGALTIPAVATLHGVPSAPTGQQHGVMSALVRSVAASVVMSPSAATLLTERYGADPRRVHVVPHGIPDLPLVDAPTIKPAVGMAGRELLLSFGLVAPGKGYEVALAALPAIVAARPTAMYVIIGVTHPDVAAADGEAYRESLVAQVERLGIGGHVQLVDRFVGRVELTRWLEAADVIVTPHADNGHRAAGTVAYAMGAGRAVVSTPGPYALDLLRDGAGVIVPARDPASLATAVIELLADPELRAAIGGRAHERSRSMTWWHVADQYRALIARAQGTPARGRSPVSHITLQA
jgi:glycosyltransferase involved in cell wall biosynthesis